MKERTPLIAGVAGLLVVLLVVFILVLPKVSAINKKNDELATARSTQTELEARLQQLKATEAQAQQIRTQLDELSAAVPPTTALPDLIRTLNDLADATGVDFLALSPGQPTAVQGAPGSVPAPEATASPGAAAAAPAGGSLPVGVSVLPIGITLNGTYFAVDEYLFRLETLPRISKVTSLTLGIGSGGYPQLALTLQANFYTTDTSAGPGSQPGAQATGGLPQGSPPPAGTGASPSPSSSIQPG